VPSWLATRATSATRAARSSVEPHGTSRELAGVGWIDLPPASALTTAALAQRRDNGPPMTPRPP
jgi:hypothetical protein